MKHFFKICFCFLSLIPADVYAQQPVFSTVYDYPLGLKNPFLFDVSLDSSGKEFTLHYYKNFSSGSHHWVDMKFDTSLKILDTTLHSDGYTRDEYIQKYFPDYRGKEYSVKGVVVEENFNGLSLRSGVISVKKRIYKYKWVWLINDYLVNYEDVESVEIPKEEGYKYFPVKVFSNYRTGDTYVLIAYKKNSSVALQDPYDRQTYSDNYKLYKVTPDLAISETAAFTFDYTQYVGFSKIVPEGGYARLDNPVTYDLSAGELVLIFTPAAGLYVPKKDPEKGNFRIFCMNGNGDIRYDLKVNIPMPAWKIQGVLHTDDDYYFIGPAKAGTLNGHSNRPSRYYQTMKISSGKSVSVANNFYKEFNKNRVSCHRGIIKAKYLAKGFHANSFTVSTNGELFLSGQNYKVKSDNTVRYKNILLFHFGSEGGLKTMYDYTPQSRRNFMKRNPSTSNIHLGLSEEKVYLEVGEYYNTVSFPESTLADHFLGRRVYSYKYNYYPTIAAIDLRSRSFESIASFGLGENHKPRYFLSGNYPLIKLENGEVIYLATDKNSQKLCLTKLRFE